MSGGPPQEEFCEFLFGPRENADGTTPAGAEERRRQLAVVKNAEALAKKHGLELRAETIRPEASAVPNSRAAEIKAIADVIMPAADERVRNEFERVSVKLPDGTHMTRTRVTMGVLDRLGEAIHGLMNPGWPGELAKKGVRVWMRVGRWFRAGAEVTSDGSEEDTEDEVGAG
jgi:hypothetical protein